MRRLMGTGIAALMVAGCFGERGPSPEAYRALLDAEDARGLGPEGVAPLIDGVASEDPTMRRLAVRALGRLERADLVGRIVPLTFDDEAEVRAEALNAVGQAAFGSDGTEVGGLLAVRAAEEDDPAVRAVLARTVGRLSLGGEARVAAERLLLELSHDALGGDAPLVTLQGVALGLEATARALVPGAALGEPVQERLRELAAYARGDTALTADEALAAARVRRLAVSALARVDALEGEPLDDALADPDSDVRRLALAALGEARGAYAVARILAALRDPNARVRVGALDAYRRSGAAVQSCLPVVGLTSDPDPHVRLAAIDYLGRSCRERAVQSATLQAIAQGLPREADGDWHAPAHALVALARESPGQVSAALMDRFAGHANPFVRMYAARAFGLLADIAGLRVLARDVDANVRTAAIGALVGLEGHDADDVLLAQLGERDPQLLLTAARLLAGTPDPEAALGAVVEAFTRVSGEGRETSRDVRMSLLDRIGEWGGEGQVEELTPYLADYDERVAMRVSELLGGWSGEEHPAAPRPQPRLPLPTAADLERMAEVDVVLEMRRGGSIRIRPLPDLAPTNAWRFVRLAEAGYFDGLTFHRVEPNFVIQGGSPGANEYRGDASYTRDEVGLRPHWRGTVGLSTRGHDTGDAQIFVNLVDNVRLNHAYTVFGKVVEGMDAVDAVLEGDVIERAGVVPR